MKRVLWVSPHKKVIYHSLPGTDGRFALQTVFDDQPALDDAKACREGYHGNRAPLEMRKVASIPMSVIHKAIMEGWINDRDAWRRWVNNPDNAALRGWQGRL